MGMRKIRGKKLIPDIHIVSHTVNRKPKLPFKHTSQHITLAKNGIHIPATWCRDVNIDLNGKPIPLGTMRFTVTPIELPWLVAEMSETVTCKRYVADALLIEVKRSFYVVLKVGNQFKQHRQWR